MRVITSFGFGEVENCDGEHAEVTLDEAFLDERKVTLDCISEISLFSPFAVVRVLNVSGAGWLSNLRFHPTSDSCMSIFKQSTPPDETSFFLNLETGDAISNRTLGLLAQDFLWIQPWLDRWDIERSETFQDKHTALESFRAHKEQLAGTSGGISANVLLDTQSKKMLHFHLSVTPPQGIIFSKDFL